MVGENPQIPARAIAVTGQRSNQLNYVPACCFKGLAETLDFTGDSSFPPALPFSTTSPLWHPFLAFLDTKLDTKKSTRWTPNSPPLESQQNMIRCRTMPATWEPLILHSSLDPFLARCRPSDG